MTGTGTLLVKGNQTISFANPGSKTFDQGPLTVSATASSGLTVTFTTTTAAVCTAGGTNGATITFVTVGNCTVRADQAGNTVFNAAPSVNQTFAITKGNQTISFGALADKTLVQSPVTVSATASSGLTVTFTSATPAVCTSSGVNGATITLLTTGTCTVNANQAGNANWNAAPQVSQSFTVSKASQTITFNTLGGKTFGNAPFTVSATASSGLTVTFTTTTPLVCTSGGTNGATITIVGAGTCTVQADQAGNATYLPAPPVQQSFTVAKANQTITFANPGAQTFDDSPLTVSGTSTSGLAVTFTTTTPAICTAGGSNGTTITFVTIGSCTVVADQAGNGNFNAAPTVSRSFNIAKGNQTISFANPGSKTFDQGPLTVSATASSGLTVTFTTTTAAVCTAGGTNGATITFVTVGNCTVRADQAGNTVFNAAPSVNQTFAITKGNQTISFGALADKTLVQSPVTVSATASSGLTVTFTSATPAVCTSSGVNGATITLLTTGTCTVNANQAGNANWNAAPQVSQSFTVSKASQTITVTTAAPGSAVFGQTFGVAATASSGLPVSITTTGGCTGAGSGSATITMTSASTQRVVHYNQAGNATYLAAPEVTSTTTAAKANTTTTITSDSPDPSVVGQSVTIAYGVSVNLPGAGT